MQYSKLFVHDLILKKRYPLILGLDEVGRGCIAGPLVVVGIVLKNSFYSPLVNDSKTIKTIDLRKKISNLILQNCLTFRIKVFDAAEIDYLNPKKSSILGMELIAKSLQKNYDLAVVDYEKIAIKNSLSIPKGDATSFAIACASIVAKSHRDTIMNRINNQYPQYLFNEHQGYCTKKHLLKIQEYGPIKKIHRFSYKTIKKLL